MSKGSPKSFVKPSLLLYASMVLTVLFNLMMWSGVLTPTLMAKFPGFYVGLREYFYYLLILDAVVAFFIFSDLILAWDDRPINFRNFHLVMAAFAVTMLFLKFLTYAFGFLLPFSL